MSTSNKIEDRVRESSSHEQNHQIDQTALENIAQYGYGNKGLVKDRIKELDQEWGIERVLEVNASVLSLTGLILGATVHKRWFILPGVVATFLLQHGIQGWCPPLPVLRVLGCRSRKEIDEERYSLKALRGDFKGLSNDTTPTKVLETIRY